jgi:hypothetical protein
MKEISIYINREDVAKAEEEERNNFIRSTIEAVGIDLDDIWPVDDLLEPKTKIALWEILSKYEIDIIHDGERGYKIYYDNKVIAEWFKPNFILREDNKAKKLSKRFFYEMQIKYFSEFEQENKDE